MYVHKTFIHWKSKLKTLFFLVLKKKEDFLPRLFLGFFPDYSQLAEFVRKLWGIFYSTNNKHDWIWQYKLYGKPKVASVIVVTNLYAYLFESNGKNALILGVFVKSGQCSLAWSWCFMKIWRQNCRLKLFCW